MIGSNLVKALVLKGHYVRVVDNLWRGQKKYLFNSAGTPVINFDSDFLESDLMIPENAVGAVAGMDYVFHLADIVAGINYVFAHQGDLFRQNLLINSNVINAVRQANPKGVIYVGTACSFPASRQLSDTAAPLREEELYPASPESAYGWSKLMGIYETELLQKETGIPTVSLILHNVYGSPADFSVERSQVIPSLIRKAIRYPDEPFVVWGSGQQARAFLHVQDVTSGLLLALEKGLGQGPIQIGPGTATSIKEIAETVVAISGKNIPIVYDTSRPEGDRSRCADYSRATELLGWTPSVSLAAGLKELYEWMSLELESGKN